MTDQINNKIKVVWICHFSNTQIRNNLKLHLSFEYKILNLFMNNRFKLDVCDFAAWVTNGINEIKKSDDIELHVISPYRYLCSELQEFEYENVFYHFFKDKDTTPLKYAYRKLTHDYRTNYKAHKRIVSNLVSKIKPDIVHLIGAENPYYSTSIFDIDRSITTIVQLQTLMSDPNFAKNYPIHPNEYQFRADCERQVILHADYIGTTVSKFRDLILKDIKQSARFLDLRIAVGESIQCSTVEKEYDVVYFAADISKAADEAIEAFALAAKGNEKMKMVIIGQYSNNYKQLLDNILNNYGISSQVTFTGRLETHEDVLSTVQKAKIALLPLKVDLISGTIREAMAVGVPVITSITESTPLLNNNRESVLLSSKGDVKGLSDNLLRILGDIDLYNQIKTNAIKTIEERYDNKASTNKWVETYKELMKKC